MLASTGREDTVGEDKHDYSQGSISSRRLAKVALEPVISKCCSEIIKHQFWKAHGFYFSNLQGSEHDWKEHFMANYPFQFSHLLRIFPMSPISSGIAPSNPVPFLKSPCLARLSNQANLNCASSTESFKSASPVGVCFFPWFRSFKFWCLKWTRVN